jgi:hypothetical protein
MHALQLDGDHAEYRGPLFKWLNAELEENRAAPREWLDGRRASLRALLDVAQQVWGLDVAFRCGQPGMQGARMQYPGLHVVDH